VPRAHRPLARAAIGAARMFLRRFMIVADELEGGSGRISGGGLFALAGSVPRRAVRWAGHSNTGIVGRPPVAAHKDGRIYWVGPDLGGS
jgi:hypothetical protein